MTVPVNDPSRTSKREMVCPACNTKYPAEHAFCPRDGTPMVPDPSQTNGGDDLVGRVLDDRYRVVGKLGVGGMGEVFEAEHIHIEKRVAIKLLRRDIMSSPDVVTRFHTEARAASAIGHHNIVEIDDFGRLPDGRVYLVMERLFGQSLAEAARGPMGLGRVVDIICQVCRGLEAAHHKGIVHRDIKPENIFLTQKDGVEVVKLLDFGIAKVTEGVGAQPNLTRTGTIFGTPHYMSPEQARGAPVDYRADLYAVGVILYELLVGNVPFRADSFMAILMQHVSQDPLPPRQAAPERNIPPALEAVVLRAMAKAPEDRFPSAEALEHALREAHGEAKAPIALQSSQQPIVLEKTPAEVRVAGVRRPRSEWTLGAVTTEWQGDGASVLVGRPVLARNRALMVAGGLGALGLILFLGSMMSRGKSASPVVLAGDAGFGAMAPDAAPPTAQQGAAAGTDDAGSGRWSHVLVESDPPGATLSSEGKWIGETPEQVSVRPNTQLMVTVRREGYRETTAVIAPGTEKVFVRMQPLAAPDAAPAAGRGTKGKKELPPLPMPRPVARMPAPLPPLPTVPDTPVVPDASTAGPTEVFPLPPKEVGETDKIPPIDEPDHADASNQNGATEGTLDRESDESPPPRRGRNRRGVDRGGQDRGEDQPLDPY